MTTAPTPISRDRQQLVERAADWHIDQPHTARPVPVLRDKFGLTTDEACRAIGLANKMRTLRAAHA